jgi:hypothetical protein
MIAPTPVRDTELLQSTQTILEALKGKGDGQMLAMDKLRLVLVYYLSVADGALTKEEIGQLEEEIRKSGGSSNAIEYVRKTREISRMTVASVGTGTSTPMAAGGGGGGELLRGLGMFSNRVSVLTSTSALAG